jgi:hypothetical protein
MLPKSSALSLTPTLFQMERASIKKEGDERASSLVPRGVTKQVIGFQLLRLET